MPASPPSATFPCTGWPAAGPSLWTLFFLGATCKPKTARPQKCAASKHEGKLMLVVWVRTDGSSTQVAHGLVLEAVHLLHGADLDPATFG
jgi:hypothetical protein